MAEESPVDTCSSRFTHQSRGSDFSENEIFLLLVCATSRILSSLPATHEKEHCVKVVLFMFMLSLLFVFKLCVTNDNRLH